MSVASAWLGDIGEYPPHPSRLSNTPLVRRLRLWTSGGDCPTSQDLEGILQYLLAMLRPLYHCYKVKNKYALG